MATSMDTSTISQAVRARMAALVESSATSATSESKEPTPLWVFLYMYQTATHDSNLWRMEDAKLLAKYLAPIATQAAPPIAQRKREKAPSLLASYELRELAKVLNTTQDVIIYTLIDMMKRDIL